MRTVRALLILILSSAPVATAYRRPSAALPEVLWRHRDVGSLNLIDGAGGKAHAPDPHGHYRFIRERLEGTSPKFDVEDADGVRWKVKLGPEPQAETAATRLVWAAGYFTDEDYYLPAITVTGLPVLHRGQSFAAADGTVRGVLLERRLTGVKKVGNWDWFQNPFLGQRELNGLRVMMALLNNWDLKVVNNAIYEAEHERRYLVSDLGASFGKTGNNLTRSKSVLDDYVRSRFVDAATPDFVDLVMHDRPFVLTIFDVGYYRERVRMEQITRHIPRADARWIGQTLSELSPDQIRDAFGAAGYTPSEIEAYTTAVRKRIAELNAF
jgi:hypothetical protein